MARIPSYFVIGHPLGHSMSPFIHSRCSPSPAGRPPYEARDIPPEQLSAALREMLPQVQGLNVTIPHKQAVIPLLDRLEGRAKLYRSVNTIAVIESGAVGYNTDADGFLCALKAGGVSLAGPGGAGLVRRRRAHLRLRSRHGRLPADQRRAPGGL